MADSLVSLLLTLSYTKFFKCQPYYGMEFYNTKQIVGNFLDKNSAFYIETKLLLREVFNKDVSIFLKYTLELVIHFSNIFYEIVPIVFDCKV